MKAYKLRHSIPKDEAGNILKKKYSETALKLIAISDNTINSDQSCGSGSQLDPDSSVFGIRIRIQEG